MSEYHKKLIIWDKEMGYYYAAEGRHNYYNSKYGILFNHCQQNKPSLNAYALTNFDPNFPFPVWLDSDQDTKELYVLNVLYHIQKYEKAPASNDIRKKHYSSTICRDISPKLFESLDVAMVHYNMKADRQQINMAEYIKYFIENDMNLKYFNKNDNAEKFRKTLKEKYEIKEGISRYLWKEINKQLNDFDDDDDDKQNDMNHQLDKLNKKIVMDTKMDIQLDKSNKMIHMDPINESQSTPKMDQLPAYKKFNPYSKPPTIATATTITQKPKQTQIHQIQQSQLQPQLQQLLQLQRQLQQQPQQPHVQQQVIQAQQLQWQQLQPQLQVLPQQVLQLQPWQQLKQSQMMHPQSPVHTHLSPPICQPICQPLNNINNIQIYHYYPSNTNDTHNNSIYNNNNNNTYKIPTPNNSYQSYASTTSSTFNKINNTNTRNVPNLIAKNQNQNQNQKSHTFEAKWTNNAKGNIYMHKDKTKQMMNLCRESFTITNDEFINSRCAFEYFRESVSLQINNKSIMEFQILNSSIIIINIDLTFKSNNNIMYIICQLNDGPYLNKQKWKVTRFMDENQIMKRYNISASKLPKSSRKQTLFQNQLNIAINIPSSIIDGINFTTIVQKQSKLKNKSIKKISITPNELKKKLHESWDAYDSITIPCVVIKKKKRIHWIEWKKLVRINNLNDYIGVSCKYDKNCNKWKIQCLDYDETRIYYQHRLVGLNENNKYYCNYKKIMNYGRSVHLNIKQ